jgi:hypothetical protein
MRIDSQVEPLVRESLAAAVARDPARTAASAQALVDRGDQVFAEAVALCYAVDHCLLSDLSEGRPAAAEISSLAESMTLMEAWADIDQPTAQTFMTALLELRDPASVLWPADAVETGFVVGAWLLSAFTPETTAWEFLLDDALTTLEFDPTPLPWHRTIVIQDGPAHR